MLTAEQLAALEMLQGVQAEEAQRILAPCRARALDPGDVLLSLGQENRTMFLILDGELSVHLDSPHSEPVAFLPAGQTVGELSVIDDSPAGAFVVACQPTNVLMVDEQIFWSLVSGSHRFARNMLMLLAQRMRANNYKISENVKLRQRYEHDAMVDGLTGVFNRRWLDEKLPRFVRRYRVGQQPLGLLLLDIDHFKRFNDDHGHAAGDRVLKVVADEMGNRLRPDDFRARYGGEEFVVILPNSDLAGSVSAAQRLRHAVKKLRVEGEDGKVLPPITVSIGAAVLAPTESAEALLARADAALYRAKDGGRDAVIVAKDEPVEATG
ncbi:MAG: diguanylate cyclase [Myxococcales bacterium]|nr:diguanylate cyclase [Myxococcales bacterium]